MSSTIDEEALIESVRRNGLLYDPFLKDYRNHLRRKEVWKEIGNTLGVPGDDCKFAWIKLRNSYTNAIKRRQPKPGQEQKVYMKWKYEDQMSFLLPAVQATGTLLNYSRNEDSDSLLRDTLSEVESELSVENMLESCNSSPDPSPTRQPTTTSGRGKSSLDVVGEVLAVMKKNSETRERMLNKHDETDLFFSSLSSMVKTLSPKEQILTKMELSQVVFRAQLRNLPDSGPPLED